MNKINDNKKIIIYSAANAHGYLTCIVHRLLFNKQNYSVYVGDDCTAKRTGGLDLFDDFILYRQIAGDYGYKKDLSPKEYEDFLISYFDKAFSEHGFAIEDVAELYIGSNWSDFPIYVNLKNIRHNIFQEAIGDLGLSHESWAVRYPCQLEARRKTGMLDGLDNKNIIKAYIHPKTFNKNGSKVEKFDIVKEMSKLTEQDKETLKKLFNVPDVNFPHLPRVLLLTQWFKKDGKIWNDDEIIKMYGLLLDLYTDSSSHYSQVVIKPHPADPKKNSYADYISELIYTVPFPSECFGLLHNSNFDLAITISSSSINTVAAVSKRQLTVKYFDQFYHISPQFFFCARVIKLLNLKCFYFGIFKEVMLPLIDCNKGFLLDCVIWHRIDETALSEPGAIIVYDNIWRDGVKHTSLSKLFDCPGESIAFIITDNIGNLIQTVDDVKYADYLYKLQFNLKPYAENSVYSQSEKKEIYIFCKDKNQINRINDMSIAIMLPHSKVVLLQEQIVQGDMSLRLARNYILNK